MRLARAARTILLATTVAAACAPAAASADLAIHHLSTAVSDFGGGDGIISPGDSLSVAETLTSSEPGIDITGLHGTLSTVTPGVTVPQPLSTFPTLSFGTQVSNDTPFGVQLDSSLECGQNVDLSLALAADQGSATVPFTIGTGIASAPVDYTATDVPGAIPDGRGALTSALTVPRHGRVKEITVHIGHITHPYDGDLRITLVAPDGTRVLLVDQRGGQSADFVNTTLTANQDPTVRNGVGPFTGTFRAEGDLSSLIGAQEEGTWQLEVSDMSSGNIGTLDS
jgi:subtilisin-like proprotein convertase family protein